MGMSDDEIKGARRYVPSQAGLNGVRCNFNYWDVNGTSQGIGTNTIDIYMNTSARARLLYIATSSFSL